MSRSKKIRTLLDLRAEQAILRKEIRFRQDDEIRQKWKGELEVIENKMTKLQLELGQIPLEPARSTGDILAQKEDEQKDSSIQDTVKQNIKEASQPDSNKKSPGGIVNKEYHVISATSDGIVDLGQVNKDGIVSGYKVRPHQRVPAPVPHFFQMDRPPLDPQEDITTPRMRQRVGGSIFRGGGTFRIEHGDNVKGGTPNDQDKERKGEMGVYIDAKNGDLVLKSRRRIRIMAEDIDIIATGKDDKKAPTGTVNITADEKIRLAAPEIFTDSKVITKIFSSGKVEMVGKMVANIYGQALELTDGRACKRGSTGDINKQLRSEWQEQMIKEGVLECDDAPGYTKGLGSSYI